MMNHSILPETQRNKIDQNRYNTMEDTRETCTGDLLFGDHFLCHYDWRVYWDIDVCEHTERLSPRIIQVRKKLRDAQTLHAKWMQYRKIEISKRSSLRTWETGVYGMIVSELSEARSQLYQRQFLQCNISLIPFLFERYSSTTTPPLHHYRSLPFFSFHPCHFSSKFLDRPKIDWVFWNCLSPRRKNKKIGTFWHFKVYFDFFFILLVFCTFTLKFDRVSG